jgi:hypothetical protein
LWPADDPRANQRKSYRLRRPTNPTTANPTTQIDPGSGTSIVKN